MLELTPVEKENYKKYHKNRCTELTRCHVDAIPLSDNKNHTHKLHSLKVARTCIDIYMKNERFICEAVPNKDPKHRHDIVNLSTGDRIEIETKEDTIKEDFDICYYWADGTWHKLVKK
jgi:hypothetical protein